VKMRVAASDDMKPDEIPQKEKTYGNSAAEQWGNNPRNAVRGPASKTAHPTVALPGVAGEIIWYRILMRTSAESGNCSGYGETRTAMR
jgi:hypothetical protein